MVIEVSPLLHIEIVVRSADKAYEFLNKVFGAEKTEIEFANFLSSYGLVKVVHVKLGNVVLQFVEPLMDSGLWAEHLKEKGPGVHNLTFMVKNVKEAMKALEQEGAKTLLEMPLDWDQVVSPEDLRPDVGSVAMIGSEEIVGFRLELGENPLKGDKLLGLDETVKEAIRRQGFI